MPTPLTQRLSIRSTSTLRTWPSADQVIPLIVPLPDDVVVTTEGAADVAVARCSTRAALEDFTATQLAQLHTGDGGVPYLKDVPLIGNLFKSQTRKRDKTELVLMIVPYIIETDTQAQELTRSLSQRFELLDLPYSSAPPPAVPVQPSVPVEVH